MLTRVVLRDLLGMQPNALAQIRVYNCLKCMLRSHYATNFDTHISTSFVEWQRLEARPPATRDTKHIEAPRPPGLALATGSRIGGQEALSTINQRDYRQWHQKSH